MAQPNLVEELYKSVEGYVRKAFDALALRVSGLEAQIKALPAPAKGEKGDPGPEGIQGKAGAEGKDGRDADMTVVMTAIENEIARSVSTIPIPKDGKDGNPGEAGKDGINGKDGKDGIDGKDGKPGDRGEHGKDGADGRDGKDGRDAKDGRDGKDGEPGRDALAIMPLDGIDHGKSYPRGTWACFRGGTFCAVRATDPFPETLGPTTLATAGWACAMDGVWDEIEEHLEDGRRIEKVTIWASGKVRKATRIGRSVIYRGLYKSDVEYTKGDQVTWNGSQWYCAADKTNAAPGHGSPDWVLAVKHGEPGKSARVESSNAPASVVKLK